MKETGFEQEVNRERETIARILQREDAHTKRQVGYRDLDTGSEEWRQRSELTRISGLQSDLEAVADVEYRRVALEKVLLVGLFGDVTREDAERSLFELAALAETAGSTVVGGALQRRDTPDKATYIGSGKARSLAQIAVETRADTIIVDDELSASQRRGLEDVVKIKVVDRTVLILDIFAQHAKSREGKAQVELAQLQYLLPRLRGWGESMSRQAGGRVAGGAGIGSRGPGETKIELDRRRIGQRISKLRRQIKSMRTARVVSRHDRRRKNVPSVAIVGYTNAGKSTLMNRMVDAGVLVHDALFATLDPTVRKARTADGREFTLTDTVGFVSRLPHELVDAFRSTLEEIAEADLVLHVVDGSHPDPLDQVRAVHDVLADIPGALDIPELIVINKVDIATPEVVARIRAQVPRAVVVSARTGEGVEDLWDAIADMLPAPKVPIDTVVPYEHGELVSRMYADGEVEKIDYLDEGTRIVGRAYPDLAGQIAKVAGVSEGN
ncbi:MAG: GTPase HflX [Varibaculum sp.]|nr:GTPase HflX [Varibaculum sp.]